MKIQDTKITQFSLKFIKGFRITLLMLVAFIGLGYLSYTQFLPRDGFPAVNSPAASIVITNIGATPDQTDELVVTPIEDIIVSLEGVDKFSSSNDGQFVNIFITFNASEVTNSQMGVDLVEEAISKSYTLPANVSIKYNPVKFDAFDGVNDLLFSISGDGKSLEELELKAVEVADLLKNSREISKVNIQSNLVTSPDGTSTTQRRANRVTLREGNQLVSTDAIQIGVVKRNNVSAAQLSEAVNKVLNSAEDQELKGYSVTITGDPSLDNAQQISSLESNLFSGLIVIALLLILLVNWRASLITVIFIPTVLLLTFTLMYIFGLTLNIISLFALILVLGIFVDDAIVVVEAIDYNKKQGLKGLDAIRKAISEVGAADVMGTLTTALVFAPILFTSGVLGEFIGQMPKTIVIALLSSLFVALTIIPLLSKYLLKDKADKNGGFLNRIENALQFIPTQITKFGNQVARFTKFSLSKWYYSLAVAIVSILLIFIGVIFGSFMFEERFNPFPPATDSTELSLSITANENFTLEDTENLLDEIEAVISDKHIENVKRIDYFGVSDVGVLGFIRLTGFDERSIESSEIARQLNAEIKSTDRYTVKFEVVSAGPPSDDFPVKFQVYSEDPEVISNISSEISSTLNGLTVEPEQSVISKLLLGEKENIVVGEVREASSRFIYKNSGRRYVELSAKTNDPSNVRATQAIQGKVTSQFNPERLEELGGNQDSLGLDLGQQSENIASLESLYLAGVIAIILMYGLLVWQFDSYLQPLLIIFVAILLAFPGVFPGLYLTGNYVSFFTTIGLIGLTGIVVNNTIMLVDYANQQRAQGKSPKEAIEEAIKVRFRPLLTTSLTTLGGLLPLALQDPFWEPISMTIILGLFSSTILVVFAFPIYYIAFEKLRDNRVKTGVFAISIVVVLLLISMLR